MTYNKNIVLVLGAGATFAEGAEIKKINLPPLDKGFFSSCKIRHPKITDEIRNYIFKNYHRDIYKPNFDSLESILTILYTDIFDTHLKEDASKTFVLLIKLFNIRLANTTNSIIPNYKRLLYKILVKLLSCNYKPKNISIITFNQDINIEKVLNYLQSMKKWKELELFTFPSCYSLKMDCIRTTSPKNKEKCFCKTKNQSQIQILKLHGSLNWYSRHDSEEFTPDILLDCKRELLITERMELNPDMKYNAPKNSYTFPIIIPPINNKSSIMHEQLKMIWKNSEQKLKLANEVIFWGYSLPDLDFESRNLFVRNICNDFSKNVVVIDPNSSVTKKYIDILELQKLKYYSDANTFIKNHFR